MRPPIVRQVRWLFWKITIIQFIAGLGTIYLLNWLLNPWLPNLIGKMFRLFSE